GVKIPAAELVFRFSRSGGPGGQNVNKRDTRAELVFDLSATAALTPEQRRRVRGAVASRLDSRGRLRIVAQSERTQSQNRARALETLRATLSQALRPRRRRVPTRPTASAGERRLAAKRARARIKKAR